MNEIELLIRRRFETIGTGESVGAAARLMGAARAGILLVRDDSGALAGVVTDRDLSLRVVGHGRDGTHLPIGEIMSRPAHTCELTDDLAEALERMNRHGIRRMPALAQGKPVGLLVLDDVLHHVAGELRDLSHEARSRHDHPTSQRIQSTSGSPENILAELEERLGKLRGKLRAANWHAREAFLGELDEIKARLRQVLPLHGEDSAEQGQK
ncbi:MAG: CBS domain-containing protein [Planctomycetota bacterium]|jgi:CBS domain-containing protein|nr:hypothetical protein [Planctomycetota bacterium]MDP6519744.1 CBS domain-containing protein [Planctomycetota bacterium]MDP6837326.1 CBS domain-containing protein [Planctomycetota bacterium]